VHVAHFALRALPEFCEKHEKVFVSASPPVFTHSVFTPSRFVTAAGIESARGNTKSGNTKSGREKRGESNFARHTVCRGRNRRAGDDGHGKKATFNTSAAVRGTPAGVQVVPWTCFRASSNGASAITAKPHELSEDK
jgi:hypothetical protein